MYIPYEEDRSYNFQETFHQLECFLKQATVNDILGGLRSTCTYVGAPTLKQLSKCTTFVRVTQQLNNVFGS